jgi:nucleotide-binding universal stress UspA family protein
VDDVRLLIQRKDGEWDSWQTFFQGQTRRDKVIQNIKSVLIGLTKEFGPDEVSSVLGYGLSLAQQAGAHATVQAASVKLVLPNAWTSNVASGLVHTENKRLHALAETVAKSAQANAAAAGVICSAETPHLGYRELMASFTRQARLHDLTIVDAEAEAFHLDRGLIETLLTESGRPLLIVPPGRDVFGSRRVILAWDGSAKAARAAGDALPFMRAAEAVEVVSVTGEKDLTDAILGVDIAPHLTRHGVRVTVHCVAAKRGDVAGALRDAAQRFEADMIVMGGFVHSRLREMVLGGVTQSLMRETPAPLLMSY